MYRHTPRPGGASFAAYRMLLVVITGLIIFVAGSSSSITSAQPPAATETPSDPQLDPDASGNDSTDADSTGTGSTESDSSGSSANEGEDRPRPRERARKNYLGRVLAQPMSHLGAPWLIRPERDDEEHASESFIQLKLEPGMTVCDLGCGNGYWTIPMAKKVGSEGRVLAVDIQREMLQKLRVRSARSKIDNIEPILSTVSDPKLPAGEVDLLLLVDVYHEFSHPESMLWGIRRSLAPTGVVALLEYRQEDRTVPIKPLHKMSKVQIMKEYQSNGFKLVREYNKLPWQHLMFFARDDSPLEQIEPVPAQQVLENLD